MFNRVGALPAGNQPEHTRVEQLLNQSSTSVTPDEKALGPPRWTAPSGMTQLASGLFAPRYSTSRWSLTRDVVKVYITADELFGTTPGLEFVRAMLQRTERRTALYFVAHWLNRLERIEAERTAVEAEFAEKYFRSETLERARALLAAGRVLLVPQALLMLAKLALVASPEKVEEDQKSHLLPAVMLAVASALNVSSSPGNDGRSFESEIVANHHFNTATDVASDLATFYARWYQIPRERLHRDLAAEFEDVTGVRLRDAAALCLALWAAAQEGRYVVPKVSLEAYVEATKLSETMALLAATADDSRHAVLLQDRELHAVNWSFSQFETHPVIDSGADLIVLSPRLLFRRIFSWLPVWDVVDVQRTGPNAAAGSSFKAAMEQSSELYARAVLDSITPSTTSGAVRVYHENEIISALGGTGVQTADAVIDYGDRWVVTEISTRKLTRGSVYGFEEALEWDIEALARKAAQVDSTIKRLRGHQDRLTGVPGRAAVTFQPVLLMTENYSVNPVINSRLNYVLRLRHQLQGSDTAPLEVISLETLDAIEALQEAGGPSLSEIIDAKQKSAYAQLAVHDYLVHGAQLTAARCKRVQDFSQRVFDELVLAALPGPDRAS